MSSKLLKNGWIAVVLVVAVATAALAIRPVHVAATDTEKDLVRQAKIARVSAPNSLDEEYTQLRYVKTTDYGATWSAPMQAGNLGQFAPTSGALADYSAIVTNGNELCYVVTLLDAATPGVYSLTGPSFSPVLVMAQGNNTFNRGRAGIGWTDVGKTPAGDLLAIVWGLNASSENTVWAVRSTDNGSSWGTPFVILTTANLDDESYPHISQMNSNTHGFVLAQKLGTGGRDMAVCRFPVGGGAANVVLTGRQGPESANQPSFYIGQNQPIAFDPTFGQNGALYLCHRAVDATGTTISFSLDGAASFNHASVSGAQRYPAMAVNDAADLPYVFSNFGVPAVGDTHRAWLAYDEAGHGGGEWTAQIPFAWAPDAYDGVEPLFYVNQGYFWDADRGYASLNLWGSFTPDGLYTTRTTDGGESWSTPEERYHFREDGFNAGSLSQNEMVGGSGGIGYVAFSAQVGVTDEEPPVFNQLTLLTDPTTLGPYRIRCNMYDALGPDTNDNHLYWRIQRLDGNDYPLENDYTQDSVVVLGGNNFQLYFLLDDTDIQQGDSVWFYVGGGDLSGNQGATDWDQLIIAGVEYQDVGDLPEVVSGFALHGNFPNPFNPSTRIVFDMGAPASVTMKVFNSLGQQVATLLNGAPYTAGRHALTFDASLLPSGIYFYTIEAGDFRAARKMVLMK